MWAIPSDYNIQKKATEKMSKYVDLQNRVPKNVEQEGTGNTNHHRGHWNSRERHSKLPPKDTRQA